MIINGKQQVMGFAYQVIPAKVTADESGETHPAMIIQFAPAPGQTGPTIDFVFAEEDWPVLQATIAAATFGPQNQIEAVAADALKLLPSFDVLAEADRRARKVNGNG